MSTAAAIAEQPPEQQKQMLALPKPELQAAVRELRDEASETRPPPPPLPPPPTPVLALVPGEEPKVDWPIFPVPYLRHAAPAGPCPLPSRWRGISWSMRSTRRSTV